jgi:pSer/pThr/pTyr-binding forkhead associated (FHA) protein
MRFYEISAIQGEIRDLSEEEFGELRPNPALIVEPMPNPPSMLRDTTTKVKVQLPAPPPLLHRNARVAWILQTRKPGTWPDVKLGRDASCDLVCPNPSVSKKHATLSNVQGTWMVEDHGSTNGTEIAFERLVRSTPTILPEGEPLVLAQVVVIRAYFSASALYAMLKRATIGA